MKDERTGHHVTQARAGTMGRWLLPAGQLNLMAAMSCEELANFAHILEQLAKIEARLYRGGTTDFFLKMLNN